MHLSYWMCSNIAFAVLPTFATLVWSNHALNNYKRHSHEGSLLRQAACYFRDSNSVRSITYYRRAADGLTAAFEKHAVAAPWASCIAALFAIHS